MAIPAVIAAFIAKEGVKKAIKKFGEKAVYKVKSSTGTNFKDAKTKTGEQSRGRIQSKDGKTTTHLMGPAVIKIQGKRDQLSGAAKGLAAGVTLSNLDKLPKGKEGSQADRKEARTGRRPSKTNAQKKADAKAERDAAFEKAFSRARNAGKSTFTFRDEGEFNTDIKTNDPRKVSRVVKRSSGGMMKKGYAKGGSVRKQSKPRGVGAAKRGYGKALR